LAALGLGRLNDAEAAAIEQHLSDCPECQAAVDSIEPDSFIVLLRCSTVPCNGPTRDEGPRETASPVAHPHPDSIAVPPELADHPRYRVLRVLGHGGMGAVYQAEHRLMQRTVAIKVIRADLVARPGTVERFQREVRAAAQLTHPNIVIAYDAEQAGAAHFLVMEYVEGVNLAQHVREHGPLPVPQACIYIRQAALGLQHAFTKRMVHRDIKPQNLLLTPQGWVKILDFGLARFVSEAAALAEGEAPGLTRSGTMMGTPDYMAPEQANDPHTADSRADLYSLGCTLFFLLTGEPPFPKGTLVQRLANHQHTPPPGLTLRRSDVPPELAAVVERLLAKDPAQRYQTPAEVAQALVPFIRVGSPVPVAIPVTSAQGAGKRPRRWPWAVAAAVLGLGLFLGVMLRIGTDKGEIVLETEDENVEVIVKQNGKLVTILDKKTNQKVDLHHGQYVAEVGKGGDGVVIESDRYTIKRGQQTIVRVRRETARSQPVADSAAGPADNLKRDQIPPYELAVAGKGDANLAPPELVAIFGDSRMKHWNRVFSVAFSPDGKTVASGSGDHTVKLWAFPSGDELHTLSGHAADVETVAFSPDGKTLACASGDKTVKLWDVSTGIQRLSLIGHSGVVTHLAYSPDGKQLASASVSLNDATVKLWDTSTGDCVWTSPKHSQGTGAVAFSPDGSLLVSGSGTGIIQVWQPHTGKLLQTLKEHQGAVHIALTFHPQGKVLVSGSTDHRVKLWDTSTWKVLHTITDHPDGGWAVAFSRDGKTLATASHDGTVILWDETGKQELCRFTGHRIETLRGLGFSPDGKTLALGGSDSTIKFWDLFADRPRRLAADNMHIVYGVAVSPDGRWLASAGYDYKVRLWDLASGKLQEVIEESTTGVTDVRFSPDGKWLAWAPGLPEVRYSNLDGRREIRKLRGHSDAVTRVKFSRDSRTLIASGWANTAKLWDVVTGQELSTLQGHTSIITGLAFSPDGKTVATGSDDKTIKLWDVASGNEQRTLTGHSSGVLDLAFRPDSRVLASVASDGTARLWDVSSGKERNIMPVGTAMVVALALSPDGHTLATASWDGKVRLWDAFTGEPGRTLTLGPHGGIIEAIAFTPDGRHLVTGNYNGTINVLRLGPPRK
jgi:WD40 repeat protein/predicted Ser/Thr protein kinase